MPARAPSLPPSRTTHRRSRSIVERNLESLAAGIEHALTAEELARADGFLQCLDARVKVAGIFSLIVAAAMANRLWVITGLFMVALVLAISSRIPLAMLAKRVWVPILIFTGAISFPALFLTPGQPVARIPLLGWSITSQGLTAAAYLVSRVETAATFSVLLAVSTAWSHLLKALRVFRLPQVCVVILGMTYRYILLLLQTAHDMFESRRSRIVGKLAGRERRRMTAAAAGVLISRSFELSEDVYLAMQSRGFRGETKSIDSFSARRSDWLGFALLAGLAAAAFWLGR